MSDCEIVTTTGGALAVRDRRVGEVMHPVVGPSVESQRLYIEPSRLADRLAVACDAPLVLWDVGLGAASNAVAAFRVSEAMGSSARRLEIVSFEHNLDALKLAASPAFAESFGLDGDASSAVEALLAHGAHQTARTSWRLVQGELPETLLEEVPRSAEVVYWDPFSPRANPTLWTMHAFVSLRRGCRDGATVHTYSGATATRAALLLAGFTVGVAVQTGQNKFATMAAVPPADVTRPLDRRWLERLGRSSAPFPPDAPENAHARVAGMPQFAE